LLDQTTTRLVLMYYSVVGPARDRVVPSEAILSKAVVGDSSNTYAFELHKT
jgi:hypothetical protein